MDSNHHYDISIDAIPTPVFIVDENGVVLKSNQAAAHTFNTSHLNIDNKRVGDVLQCLYSFETTEGCGHSNSCNKCITLNSIAESYNGEIIVHRNADLLLKAGEIITRINSLITVNQLHISDRVLAILIIKDITNLFAPKEIVPICMHCHRLRDDGQHWHTTEDYLDNFLNIKLSHCICTSCLTEFYSSLVENKKTEH